MKKEYDFSNGVRGKFYNPEANFKLPIYLDDDVQFFFMELAKKKKMNYSAIVNNTIKANIQLIKEII